MREIENEKEKEREGERERGKGELVRKMGWKAKTKHIKACIKIKY